LIYSGSQLGRLAITLISETAKLQKIPKTIGIPSENHKNNVKILVLTSKTEKSWLF
jgi:hypothetical protein